MLPFRASAGKWQINIPSDTETALSLTHGSAQLALPSGGAFSVKKDDGKYTLKTSGDSTLSITITEDDVELYKEKTFLAKVGDIDESQLYELLARQFPVSVDSGQNPEEEGDPSGGRRKWKTALKHRTMRSNFKKVVQVRSKNGRGPAHKSTARRNRKSRNN